MVVWFVELVERCGWMKWSEWSGFGVLVVKKLWFRWLGLGCGEGRKELSKSHKKSPLG